jgi:transposase
MFVRKKKNKSGSISVQIISKTSKKYKVIKSLGSSTDPAILFGLELQAKQEIQRLESNPSLFVCLFVFENDILITSFLREIQNGQIRTIGPELVFGKIFDFIGFNTINEPLFRHLVIARLAFPLSKLKTIDYLYRFQGIVLDLDTVYRFLDKLNNKLKNSVELIAFNHIKRVLNNNISVVFYDMTTLYFEASDEDDLRKTGFSKDGKHSNPQIFLGLLVALGGYTIGYDIFEGNIYEGHTLIPTIEKISKKFNLSKPVVVADAGLLSSNNIKELQEKQYEFILGARIKNETTAVKNKIFETNLKDNEFAAVEKSESLNLILSYSDKRAKKDAHNRKKGLERLEKQIKSGKLTKSNINNRGYNKYLKMEGEINIVIDKEKYEKDKIWDGLKGYVTNCKLKPEEIIANYKNLWHIEKAFRMSKTDLRIRPIYHRLRNRIEAHICLSFVAYTIYKELERVLKIEKYPLSVEKAAELTHNMYQIEIILPESLHTTKVLLKMDENQRQLIQIIDKYF